MSLIIKLAIKGEKMDMNSKIPLKKGMWTIKTNGEIRLVGSMCPFCNEVFFPKRVNLTCIHCQKKGLQDVELGPYGKIVSFSAAMQPPAGGFYHGKVPYCYGLVDLDEGVRVQAHLLADVGDLYIGMHVEIIVETLYTNSEGEEIQFFCFRSRHKQKHDRV